MFAFALDSQKKKNNNSRNESRRRAGRAASKRNLRLWKMFSVEVWSKKNGWMGLSETGSNISFVLYTSSVYLYLLSSPVYIQRKGQSIGPERNGTFRIFVLELRYGIDVLESKWFVIERLRNLWSQSYLMGGR